MSPESQHISNTKLKENKPPQTTTKMVLGSIQLSGRLSLCKLNADLIVLCWFQKYTRLWIRLPFDNL